MSLQNHKKTVSEALRWLKPYNGVPLEDVIQKDGYEEVHMAIFTAVQNALFGLLSEETFTQELKQVAEEALVNEQEDKDVVAVYVLSNEVEKRVVDILGVSGENLLAVDVINNVLCRQDKFKKTVYGLLSEFNLSEEEIEAQSGEEISEEDFQETFEVGEDELINLEEDREAFLEAIKLFSPELQQVLTLYNNIHQFMWLVFEHGQQYEGKREFGALVKDLDLVHDAKSLTASYRESFDKILSRDMDVEFTMGFFADYPQFSFLKKTAIAVMRIAMVRKALYTQKSEVIVAAIKQRVTKKAQSKFRVLPTAKFCVPMVYRGTMRDVYAFIKTAQDLTDQEMEQILSGDLMYQNPTIFIHQNGGLKGFLNVLSELQ